MRHVNRYVPVVVMLWLGLGDGGLSLAIADGDRAAIEIDADTNQAADVIILEALEAETDDPPRQADAEDAEQSDEEPAEDAWEGRRFEAEVVVMDQPAIVAANWDANQADDPDPDDPFGEILKKQPQFADYVQQIRSQAELVIGGDFTFAAHVCKASEQERQAMRRLAKLEFRGILVEIAKHVRGQFGWGPMMGNPNAESFSVVRYKAVERVLIGVYWKDKASGAEKPRQLIAWQDAHRKRTQYRAVAKARVLVAVLDDRLFLSAEQREKLTQSMAGQWQDEWDVYVSIVAGNPEYFPMLPKESIEPILNKDQLLMWREMPKSQMGAQPWAGAFDNGIAAVFGVNNRGELQLSPWFHEPDEIEAIQKENANVNPARRAGVLFQANQLLRAATVIIKKKSDDDPAEKAPGEAEASDEDDDGMEDGKENDAATANTGDEKKVVVSLHEHGWLGLDRAVKVVSQAIADGADVNEVSSDGVQPLHVAAVNGAEEMVDVLIEQGADVAAKTAEGKRAADLAREHGFEALAERIERSTRLDSIHNGQGSQDASQPQEKKEKGDE